MQKQVQDLGYNDMLVVAETEIMGKAGHYT